MDTHCIILYVETCTSDTVGVKYLRPIHLRLKGTLNFDKIVNLIRLQISGLSNLQLKSYFINALRGL